MLVLFLDFEGGAIFLSPFASTIHALYTREVIFNQKTPQKTKRVNNDIKKINYTHASHILLRFEIFNDQIEKIKKRN